MTNDLSQCGNCIYHYTYNGQDMCKQVGDDFYLQWKVENCPYHTTITRATAISDEIYRLRAENADLHEKFATLNKMPCNIGDTVYVLFGSCYRCEDYEGDHCSCEKMGNDKVFEMKVGSVWFDKDDYYLYEDPIGITSGLSCSGRNYGNTWFLSMEEAKNHLMKSYDDMLQRAQKT